PALTSSAARGASGGVYCWKPRSAGVRSAPSFPVVIKFTVKSMQFQWRRTLSWGPGDKGREKRKHGLEPVLFPGQDFHVLFRLRMARTDPLPVVTRFLRRALKEGLLDRTPVGGRVLTPLGYVAVLEDRRLAAFVYVPWGQATYASHYTIFPS